MVHSTWGDWLISYGYPHTLEIARIGDRIDLDSPGIVPPSTHRGP